MQISVIADDLVLNDKSGYLGNISGHVTLTDLEMFAKVCLRYHICCGLFFNKKRNLDNFKEIWFLQFDFDNGVTHEEIINKLGKTTNMVIMASKNHMKDKNDGKGEIPRFHVFLPMQKPINDSEFYHFCIKFLSKKWDIPIDVQATDATRYMFKHSKCLYINKSGWNLDISAYQLKLKWIAEVQQNELENEKRTERLKIENKNNNISFEQRLEAAKKIVKNNIGESIEGNDGDRTTFIAMCCAVQCGLSDEKIKEFSNWYNQNYCRPQWSNKALQHKIKSAKKKVLSGDHYPPRYILKVLGKENHMKNFK